MKAKIVDPNGKHYEVASLSMNGIKVVKAIFQCAHDAIECAAMLDRERPGKHYVIVTRMGTIEKDIQPRLHETY